MLKIITSFKINYRWLQPTDSGSHIGNKYGIIQVNKWGKYKAELVVPINGIKSNLLLRDPCIII
jgi:hypothetical protein